MHIPGNNGETFDHDNAEPQPTQPLLENISGIAITIGKGVQETVTNPVTHDSGQHAPFPEFSNEKTWSRDDLFWLLRPFAPVLRPADRLVIAERAYAFMCDGDTFPDGPPRASNPLPALAAELADFVSQNAPAAELGWKVQPGAVITDYLTDKEVALLERWAEGGPAPTVIDNPPGPEFEELPEHVQALVRECGPAWGKAAAAAIGMDVLTDEEAAGASAQSVGGE